MADRISADRSPDLAALLGRPVADPLNTQDIFRAQRDINDFQPAMQGGVLLPNSTVSPLTGTNLAPADAQFTVGGAVPDGFTALSSTLSLAADVAGTTSLQAVSTVNDVFGVYVGEDASAKPIFPVNPGDTIYVSFSASASVATNDLIVAVQFDITGTDQNLGNTVLSYVSDGLDRLKVSDGVATYSAYVRAPAGAAFYRVGLTFGYLLSGTIGDTVRINSIVVTTGSVLLAPLATNDNNGPRQEFVEAHNRLWTAHVNETAPGKVAAVISTGASRSKDLPELLLQSPTHTAGPAQLALKGAPSDASASALVSAISGFEALAGFALNTIDIGKLAIADASPLLSAIGTVNQATVTLQTFAVNNGKKCHILFWHVGMLVVSATGGTDEQVGQTLCRLFIDGGTATAGDFIAGWSICGTGSERVSYTVAGGLMNVNPTGDIKVLIQPNWIATRTFGAGGSKTLNFRFGNLFYAIIPSAQ